MKTNLPKWRSLLAGHIGEDSSTDTVGVTDVDEESSSDELDLTEAAPAFAAPHEITYTDADSIIGGHSLFSGHENDVEDDTTAPAGVPTKTDQLKVFSFSLPFNNPLANIDMSMLDLPTINFRSMLVSLDGSSSQVSDKQSSIAELDSDEEETKYSSIRRQDNTRVRAVRKTITRNFTLATTSAKLDGFPLIDGDVVVMGGYRGSILRDTKTKRRVWIPIKVGLNIRKIDLTIGSKDEDEHNAEKTIYPDGVLSHIGPIDICRKLIRKLQMQPRCNVHEFGYDWRLSSDINSKKLREFLRHIEKKSKNSNTKKRGVIVIAHSMGGLIAHHAMQKEPELFRGLLYAGSPSSCPNILGPLRYGDSVLLSSRVLTAKICFLMRSSFVFLPLSGECFVDAHDSKKKYKIDFFDPETWEKYGLSPCVAKSAIQRRTQNGLVPSTSAISNTPAYLSEKLRASAISNTPAYISDKLRATPTKAKDPLKDELPLDEAREYLVRTLARTKKFLQELEYDPSTKYPPLAVLYGCTIPTLRGAKVNGPEGIEEGDYDHLWFGAGDGVVYRKWLMPERVGFKVAAKIPSESSHVTLLTDIDGVGKALQGILTEEAHRRAKAL